MTRERLIERLCDLPMEIRILEDHLLDLEGRQDRQRWLRQESVDHVLLRTDDNPINGKNAEIREAQLRRITRPYDQILRDKQVDLDRVKFQLHEKQNELKAFRAAALVLGGGSV